MPRRDPMPKLTWILDIPDQPDDLIDRRFNRFNKDALRFAILKYHRDVSPRHFTREAHTRYKHADRQQRYIRYKARRYRSVVDLVKTGATRQAMTAPNPKVRIGGSATGGGLRATLVRRFPFAGGSGRFRPGQTRQAITLRQMRRELETVTADEGRQIVADYRENYLFRVDEFRSTRRRRRVRVKT